MLLDKDLQVSALQAVTVDAASASYIDLGAPGDAVGHELTFIVRVGTAFESNTGGATCEFILQTCAESGFSSPTQLFSSGALEHSASLLADSEVVKAKIAVGLLRYVRAYYNVSATMTAGTVDAFFVKDSDISR